MSFVVRLLFTVSCLASFTLTLSTVQAQPGGPGGPGGIGGPGGVDVDLVEKFDADKNGRLDDEERALARKEIIRLQSSNQGRRRGGPGGGPGGPRGGGNRPSGRQGPKVAPADVQNFSSEDLFDPDVLRTVFLTFEADDWEKELQDFKPTDVEVPATMMVDGKEYPNVGVSFRGASSFFMISEGSKRSFNISMDYIDKDQRLLGYKSLNLLNGNGDDSMMSSALYSHFANQHIPAPKVNFVKVVVNGRSWGIYSNSQQFNKTFLKEHFDTDKGSRWKVLGNPRGDGGLRYLGADVEQYKSRFEIKSKDKPEAWESLINLCKVLNQTPQDQLISKLEPLLDIDSVLWFLAYDVAFINSDGYWTRASDYSIYLDPKGKFHIIPHDMNESFTAMHSGGGPGGGRGGPGGRGGRRGGFGGPPQGRPGGPPRGGPGGPPQGGPGGPPRGGPGGPPQGGPGDAQQPTENGSGFELNPLASMTDRFPLRSKLLAIPELKAKYLKHLESIASNDLSSETFEPLVAKFKEVIQKEIKKDTRKLMSNSAFEKATKKGSRTGLNKFAAERAEYLLNYPAIKQRQQQ